MMTARLVVTLVLLLVLSVLCPKASAITAQMQTAAVSTEPTAPKPSAAVEKMLDEARRLAEAKQPVDSLKMADQALDSARQANDTAGAALAQQARAKALHDLQRTDEAVVAWQAAAQTWAAVGNMPGEIKALVQAGLVCVSQKKSDAEKFFAQGLSVGKTEGPRPGAVAQALHDAGVTLGAQGQEQAAMDYLSAALAIREEQTPESLKLVETLNALAKLVFDHGTSNFDEQYYSRAKAYSARAAAIGQRLAPDSAAMVESLHILGKSENLLGSATAAVEHYLAALQIQKSLVPDGSGLQAEILNDLGWVEMTETNYATAREHLEESVAIAARLAPESLQFGHSLETLANVEGKQGDLAAARDHMQHALGIKEKFHGALAPTYINLGALVLEQGDFAAARDYFEKALAPYTNVAHKPPVVPAALFDLSETFYRQGDLASALEDRRRALAIYEDQWGAGANTATALNGMGDILRAEGNFSSAADYYHRALDMRERLDPESFYVSDTLSSLAKLAHAQGNRTLATEYDRRALEMGQKSCPNSWCVVGILNDLGDLAYEQGKLANSERYLRQAVDIREKSLGPMHPDLARSLNSLALTVAAQGKTSEALTDALRAERIGAEHLRVSVRTLSERQALAYEGVRASGLDLALTLADDRTNATSARSEVFDAVIHSRALVFDELAARHRSAYGSGDHEVTQFADQLFSARTRLATLVFRGAGDTKPEAFRNLLEETRDQKEKAERLLAEKSAAFRHDQARAQLGLKEVAESLPQGTALVAFVRYARYDLQRPGTGRPASVPVPSYAAFVLRGGGHEPEFVPLGGARGVESLLAAWRRGIGQEAEGTDAHATTGETAYLRAGAAFRRKIWDPLQPILGHAKEVFVVPDAALHLVNLGSLPVGSAQYLIETGPLIHYLSTERDLVPVPPIHGEGILVVGNPAFDQSGKLVMASNKQPDVTSATAGAPGTLLRGTRSACGTFQTLRFPPLPASQQEAENIAALWEKSTSREGKEITRGPVFQPSNGESMQMTGVDARLEAFEQYAPGKRVLHVATHGFFLEGSCESALQRRRDPGRRDEEFLPATAENPLLLSGLAFAGANRRSTAKPDESDGILTAEEIAGINLEGVDWAVLSACDTGVGTIKTGEGVFGLRRAFQVAGAKTVIISLWPVEDEETRQWMTTLYGAHFLDGKDTAESVREASIHLLKQRRRNHQSTHPFYWAAFIAAGDWH